MDTFSKYIIKIKDDIITGHNCFLASLRCITRHYGCSYSEVQLFFLSNSFKIRYGNDLNEIGRHTLEGLNEFGKRTSISINIHGRNSNEMVAEQMCRSLRSSMLMLDVNTRFLRYNKIYLENENRKHVIVLYGIDINNKTAYIMDPYMLDYRGDISAFRGQIPFDEMVAAADRYFFFCFDNKKDLSESEILQYACSDIQKFIDGSEDDQGAIGSKALRNYLKDIIKLETLDNQDLTSTCATINYNIKIRSFNLINQYMKDFLDNSRAIRKIGDKDLSAIIEWHIAEWNRIGLAILRIGIAKRKGNLHNICKESMQLFDSQMEACQQFHCVLNEMASSCY